MRIVRNECKIGLADREGILLLNVIKALGFLIRKKHHDPEDVLFVLVEVGGDLFVITIESGINIIQIAPHHLLFLRKTIPSTILPLLE